VINHISSNRKIVSRAVESSVQGACRCRITWTRHSIILTLQSIYHPHGSLDRLPLEREGGREGGRRKKRGESEIEHVKVTENESMFGCTWVPLGLEAVSWRRQHQTGQGCRRTIRRCNRTSDATCRDEEGRYCGAAAGGAATACVKLSACR
jgi:hypothetical protein